MGGGEVEGIFQCHVIHNYVSWLVQHAVSVSPELHGYMYRFQILAE